ncbi:MAG: ABC transporter permease [Lachnospiraceae bacterium]|nr:ABC transporter permease [Lachnospiraceae bacterium]
MYWHILKKDLKRKKTMNIILLLFVLLAAMFIASGASNMVTIFSALDNYFEMAGVPSRGLIFNDTDNRDKYRDFANSNNYDFQFHEMISVSVDDIKVDGKKLDFSNIICIETLENPLKVFDSRDNEITTVNEGEIYITSSMFYSEKNNFKTGCNVQITANGKTRDFTLKDYAKNAIYSPAMSGLAKILVSQKDYDYLKSGSSGLLWECSVYTDDEGYNTKISKAGFSSMVRIDYDGIKLMYILDVISAAAVLLVSICIILISMVMLRFTINFTMSEEFREIGVMKAIGIRNGGIRLLYLVKYFAISVIGATAGFILSIPFGNILLQNISKNIIVSGNVNYMLNLLLAVSTVFIVVLFCYFCTRNINKISPVSAIRNGGTGERYAKKGFINLWKSRLAPVFFMALNDILSKPGRYVSMAVVFTLGILLVIVPVNTINTFSSDSIIELFGMAKCDHVISQELFSQKDNFGIESVKENIDSLKKELNKNNIDAMVFQEIVFKAGILYNGRKMEVMAGQGNGDIDDGMYAYIEGTPPANPGEIAISNVVAKETGAGIGDDAEVNIGNITKTYIVTAVFQSMQNTGQSIRIYHNEDTGSETPAGVLGIQVRYNDKPGSNLLADRMKLLETLYPDDKVYDAGGYIASMTGNVAEQIGNVKNFILGIVFCINILVTVLMAKSFITKEKGGIAVLKAIGFKNIQLACWQTLRILIILFISFVLGILLSTPFSQLLITPIFRMMGAYSIEFNVNALEVYLLYPLAIFAVTSFAAFISSQGVRKIQVSQASNIE